MAGSQNFIMYLPMSNQYVQTTLFFWIPANYPNALLKFVKTGRCGFIDTPTVGPDLWNSKSADSPCIRTTSINLQAGRSHVFSNRINLSCLYSSVIPCTVTLFGDELEAPIKREFEIRIDVTENHLPEDEFLILLDEWEFCAIPTTVVQYAQEDQSEKRGYFLFDSAL